jgi:hypothetical protein
MLHKATCKIRFSGCRGVVFLEGVSVESAVLLDKLSDMRRIDLVEKPITNLACMFDSAPRPSEMRLSTTMSPTVIRTMRSEVALRASWKVCVVVGLELVGRVGDRKRIATGG